MTRVLPFHQTLRNVRRYTEILSVLVRYGFGDVVAELRLDRLLERGMRLVGAGGGTFAHEPRQVRLRKAMEELGPTFIKMGQVLSVRPDLIPAEWAQEFSKLQDACPQMDFSAVRQVLEEQFSGRVDELFTSIEAEPLAAASMAQVHRAVLRDGSRVVLKILRPGIRQTTHADMEILRTLAEFAEQHLSNLGYSPSEVVNEFARELRKETDLTREGKATDRLRRAFADDPAIVFPRVYWEVTTRDVLALEEMPGRRLSRLKVEDIAPEDRQAIVQNVARAVLRQCLDIGFFHADPHPGNIFVLPGGHVGFIDCGMTGQLDVTTMRQLGDLVAGVVLGDMERVILVIGQLTDAEPDILEQRPFRSDVREFIGHFENTPLERLNVGELLREFFDKLRLHHLRCPGDLVLLIKALTTVEAVGSRLDPAFDLMTFARPYVEAMGRQRFSVREIRRRFAGSMLRYAEFVEQLPAELRTLLMQLRRNRLTVNLEHHGLNQLTRTIDRASRVIAFALIIAAMLVGSSILVLAERAARGGLSLMGLTGFIAAFLLAVLMLVVNRRGKRD